MAGSPITLGGKNVWDAPGDPAVNWFYSRTGASNYGYGFFLLLRSDFDLINGSTGESGQVTLSMQADQGPGLSISVLIAGAEPYAPVIGAANAAGNQSADLMRVKVIDLRAKQFQPIDLAFNMMSQDGGGFSWDSTHNIATCYSETLNAPNTPWTWTQILGPAGAGFTVLPAGVPTWVPYNIAYNQAPVARMIDDLTGKLFYVVGYTVTANSFTLNVPGVINAVNAALYTQCMASPYTAGGIGERNPARLPSQYVVGFTSFNADTPNDPYTAPAGYERTKTFTESVGDGNPLNLSQPLACGEAIAIWQSGAYANYAKLNIIAADLADRAYVAVSVVPQQREFAGIWPFSPDGAIRSVLWSSNHNSCKTVIRINNDRDANPLDDLRRVMEERSNQFIQGLGTSVVGMDSGSGARQVWTTPGTSTVTGQITDVYASVSGGAGRYKMAIGTGQVTNLDPTSNFRPPDANMTFPMVANAVWCNVFEAGSAANKTCVVAVGSIVQGVRVGSDNENPALPVYYGGSAPAGTLFEVVVVQNGGANGNASTRVSYTYNVFLDDNSLQLATAITPETVRPIGYYNAAVTGTAYLDTTGVLVLYQVDEELVVTFC